jgi:hypothetical protein
MKTTVLLFALAFSLTAKAQFSQNFDGSVNNLTSNCWTINGGSGTTDVSNVIAGSGSILFNPSPTPSVVQEISTPALEITNTTFTVAFKYKLSNGLNPNATRSINVGLTDVNGVFTSLAIINLDNNTPTSSLSYSQSFTLASTGARRLTIKFSGDGGDGNARVIFDDLSVNASAKYGTGTCNAAPVAVNDTYSAVNGSVVTGNLVTNDSEPNGESITASVVLTSADGTVVLNSNGSFTFTPSPSFTGAQTTFTYRLQDNGFTPLFSNTATVTINYFVNIPLPVKLISFNAKYSKPNAAITWSTAQEMNFSHFVLEQSTDGINFTAIATIFGAGESTSQKDYSYTDRNLAGRNGLVYYRLVSVDLDGKTAISQIRIIKLGDAAQQLSLITYPNPAAQELKITIPASWQNKKVVYEIFSISGQVAKKMETANSSQTETLNVSQLNSGLYFVKATCEGETAQQRIVKQ